MSASGLLRRQAASGAQLGEHNSYAAVEGLEHHWGKLSDERKETFAQMAVLTRQASFWQQPLYA